MPARPYPHPGSIKPKVDISFSCITYSQYLSFLLQTSNCSKDKLFMREEATGRTIESPRTCSAYFSRPAMKITIMLTGNDLQHNDVCSQGQIFYHSFILKDYISLQATRQIFVDRLATLRQSISHSHSDNIHSHLIYPAHNASLLSVILPDVHGRMIIMSYDHPNFVTELNEFDRSKIRESRNVNISICSMKITIMLTGNYLKCDIVCI
jgi:hypothetical protein